MKRTILLILAVLVAALLFVSCEMDNTQIYTVTFHSNGGSEVKSQQVLANGYATKPKSPEKEEYSFLEWQKAGEKFDFGSTPITSNITLCAVWTKETYTVTFNANGGTFEDSSEPLIETTINYNDKVEAPTVKKDESTFLGWYCGKDEFNFDIKITSDLELTAKWQDNPVTKYTVVFKNGAEVKTQEVEAGSPAVKPEDPTDDSGGTFVGWIDEDGNPYYFGTPVNSNIILYAKWENSGTPIAVNFCNVRFEDVDGSYIYGTTVQKGTTVIPADPVSKDRHMTFNYWIKKGDMTLTPVDPGKTPITDDVTFVAVWRYLKKGDKGPAGGIIFYDAGEVKTGIYHDEFGNTVSYLWRYLEAAPEDLDEYYVFGYYRDKDTDKNKEVGTGINPGEGRLNTAALVHNMYNPVYEESGGSTKSPSIAAMCRYYSVINVASAKTYSDWFLPSMAELAAMYEMKDILGMKAQYWSSSEYDWDYAYYIDFKTGEMDLIPRSGWATARPIRAF